MENKCYCGHTTRCECGPETLEEVTDRLFDSDKMFVNKIFFMRGAEWQKEQSYSEEDMIDYSNYRLLIKKALSPNEWFEQFKKK